MSNFKDSPLKINGKIFVCCPGDSVSGGPELLHQLVDALRQLGHNAYITYYPFYKKYSKPNEYFVYDCPSAQLEDNPSALIVIPEVFTKLSTQIRQAKVAIWWLSVDNYYHRKGTFWIQDQIRRLTTLLHYRIPLKNMQHLTHLTQSKYAHEFLKTNGINSRMLTDYLAIEHTSQSTRKKDRCKIIAYNPNKGFKKTQQLIKAHPNINFTPIKDMSKNQVNELLSRSMIYIDFGLHPGKDRIPREAAMAGCCIITGRSGSAGNNEDIPIPEKYKLNERSKNFIKEFEKLAESIFHDFDSHSYDFQRYRKIIASEQDNFRKQLINIFGKNQQILIN